MAGMTCEGKESTNAAWFLRAVNSEEWLAFRPIFRNADHRKWSRGTTYGAAGSTVDCHVRSCQAPPRFDCTVVKRIVIFRSFPVSITFTAARPLTMAVFPSMRTFHSFSFGTIET